MNLDLKTIVTLEKEGLDTGVHLIVDQLSKKNIFDFNVWDFLSFVGGDVAQRYIVDSEKFNFLTFLEAFPYDNILERVLIIELFRILYVALSTKPDLNPLSVLIDFFKLSFSLGISDSLYPLVDQKLVEEQKKKKKDICDKHKWLWAFVGPCVGLKASNWLWKEEVPNIAGDVIGKQNITLIKIIGKLVSNSPLIVISGLLWLLLTEEGRALVGKTASPAGSAVSAGLSFAPLLFL